jgi:uncharacterized protein DUF4062
MISWSADERSGTEHSVDRVRQCDVFILLLAHRHGYVAAGSSASVTEVEYLTARWDGRKRTTVAAPHQRSRDLGPHLQAPVPVRVHPNILLVDGGPLLIDGKQTVARVIADQKSELVRTP